MAEDFAAQLRSDATAVRRRGLQLIARGMHAAAEHMQELEGEPAAIRAAVRTVHTKTPITEHVGLDHPSHDDWYPTCRLPATHHRDHTLGRTVCSECGTTWPCNTIRALNRATTPDGTAAADDPMETRP